MFTFKLWIINQLLRWVNATKHRQELADRRFEKVARKFDALLVALHRAYQNVDCHIETNGEKRVQGIIASTAPQIVFDVGANKGDWSQTFHAFRPQAQIHAFEPMQETFGLLKTNAPFVKAHHCALGAKNEQVTFGICVMSEGSSKYTGATETFRGSEIVQVRRGDDVMAENQITAIDYLKIDAEGMDYEVLQGFQNAIETGRIGLIQFEYSKKNIEPRSFLADFYKLLRPYYVIGRIFPTRVDFYDYNDDHEDFALANFLCVKKGATDILDKLKTPDDRRRN